MTVNTGFEQPRVPGGVSARSRRGQALMGGNHSVLKELGLGTNDPESALHIVKETAGASLLLERIQASVNSGSIQSRKSRGTLDDRAAVVDDDDLLTISSYAYVGDTNTYQEVTRIDFEVDGSVSDASRGAPSRMVFRTCNGSGLFKRMRIDKDGNVGIGLDAPSTRLTVEGAVTLKEQSAADADVGSYGQVWVKTATPNQLYFTTDAGNDIQLTSGTAVVSVDTTVAGDSGSTAITPGDTLTIAGGTACATAMVGDTLTINSTNTTYSAGNGISLSGTAFSVAGGAGLVQESSGLALDDPINLSELTESTDATDDKILLWDEDAGAWKYMTLDNLQDSIDTGGGGGEANEDSFKTIAVSGQDNVVADSTTDTLTFAQAGGITLTTTAASDTVTISSADTNTQLTQEQVEDYAGALVASGGTKTGISVTYQDGTGDMDFAVSDLTVTGDSGSTGMTPGDTLTIAGGTACATAMSGDTLTINATDTNTTYSAGTLLDLSTTTFNVDLTEAAEAVMANGDYILFLDGGATGSHAKEAIADVATLFAGDGLTASSSVMAVNVDDSTIETNSDAIRVKDNGVTLAKMAGLARGSIIYGDASGDPAALSAGSNTYVLTSDGTDISWASAGGGSGDITSVVAGAGMTGGATSGAATLNVIGGDGITANADDIELTDNGVTLAKMAGLARGKIIYGDASGDPAALTVGSNTYVLTSDGTDVAWAAASGGGSGDVEAGSTFTTAGVIMACDGDDKTIDEPTALLTTNGQGMTVSAALATPFQVDSSTRDGNSTFKFTTGSGAGTNNHASIQVIAQTAANASVYLGDTSSATKGGLKYKNNGDSMQLVADGNAVLELDSDKVVEFKIAEVADSGSDYAYDSKVLKIKVNGTEYFLQLYAEAGGNGGGMP